MKIDQWVVTVDLVPDQGWEASIGEGHEYIGWESTDVHTLLAAVARDLAEISGSRYGDCRDGEL